MTELRDRASTLLGDVRDQLLQVLQSIEAAWPSLAEARQGQLITAMRQLAERVIREIAQVIAARGFPAVPVKVGRIVLGGKAGKISSAIETDFSVEAIATLAAAHGKTAMLVVVDEGVYAGESAPALPDPDQPMLKLEPARVQAARRPKVKTPAPAPAPVVMAPPFGAPLVRQPAGVFA